ncbi:MAG: toxic anion resistance protein [Solobacterium sp.]|nr:toxic anion resistance protein [Solobacterium sp.]
MPLSEEQKQQAQAFAAQIDIGDAMQVLKYGSAAQKKVSRMTSSSLLNIPVSDLNEIGEDINAFLVKLKTFEQAVKREKEVDLNTAASWQKYKELSDRLERQMNETARRLEIHRSSLLRHISRLEKLYEEIMQIITEFDMYLYAGREYLKVNAPETLKLLSAQAKDSDTVTDTLRFTDYKEDMAMFEKKLDDLRVSRQLPLQLLSQIKLMETRDILMGEGLLKLYGDQFSLYRTRILLSLGLQEDEKQSRLMDKEHLLQAVKDLREACLTVLKIRAQAAEK